MLMDILAGLLTGLIMSTVFLGAFIYLLASNRDAYERLAERLPSGISPLVFLLVVVFGIPPVWMVLGAIAGLAFNLIESAAPDGGLGSGNLLVTIIALCIGVLAAILSFVLKRDFSGTSLLVALAFAGIFGWLLPLLGEWR